MADIIKIKSSALKIAFIYLAIGVLWILLSDSLVRQISMHNRALEEALETYKGIFYVISTSVLLFFLIRNRERKREKLEDEILVSNEKWLNAFESANDPIFVLDKKYNILETNLRAQDVYGYSVDEFKKMNIKDMRSVDDYDVIRVHMNEALNHSGAKYEMQHIKKDGSAFPVEISTRAVTREGKLEFIHIVHDLSGRRHIEDKLVESERKYRTLVETSHELIWILDRDLRFTFVNDAGRQVYGINPNELLGRRMNDFVSDKESKDNEYFIAEAIKSGKQVFQYQNEIIDNNGKTKHLLSNCVIIKDSRGIFTGLCGTSLDITERVESENRIKYLNRIYALLTNINKLIVRASDKERILNEACRLAVEYGKFNMAWIGVPDFKTGILDKKYKYGDEDDYLIGLNISINEAESVRGPIVAAIRENTFYVSNDIENDVTLMKWRKGSLEKGFRSFATFPIEVKNKVVAVYNIYSDQKNFFGKQETELLLELVEDISFALEYIELEDERHAIEKRYKNIVERTPVAIFVQLEGRITYINPAAVKILKAESYAELLNKPIHDIIHKDYHPIADDRLKQISQGKEVNEIEEKMIRMDGSSVDVMVSAIPYNQGELSGGQYFFRDLTEQKKSEDALVESRARLKALVDSAMDAILSLNSKKEIVLFNEAAEKMFKYSFEEVKLKGLNILFPEESNEQQYEMLDKYDSGNDFGNLGILSGLRSNGDVFPIEASISHININGETYYTAIFRDVTDRMEYENAIRDSNDKLHALAAHLQTVREEERTLIAREIHDQLGQELTALKMDISFLSKKIKKSKDTPDWDGIIQGLESMSTITDQTINSVRRIATELRPDILDKLGLKEAIEWHAEEFEKRSGIKCIVNMNTDELNLTPELNTTVYRIIQESLTNVARHSGASQADIDIKVNGKYMFFSIKDNGRGIHESEIENTKSLGLVGIKERAYTVNGEFEIKGEKDKGTEIKITIPLT